MMYRVTCLTPTLAGDGASLSPIDYMVWKDQVNVLAQNRIFRLLSKGPRLDNYLNQIKRADRLDFASWGGFAQNFADRRIPFEHSSAAQHWESLRSDQLFIPTFAARLNKPYLPGSALKGALRTAFLASRVTPGSLNTLGERPSASTLEAQFIGKPGSDALKGLSFGDSDPLAPALTKVYLVRTSTLERRQAGGPMSLGWKQASRAPQFAEMVPPGVEFRGAFSERSFGRPPRAADAGALCRAANGYAKTVIEIHRRYAGAARWTRVVESLEALLSRAEQAPERTCILPLGWGTGYLGKTCWPQTDDANFRRILEQLPYYSRTIKSGFPFPKTRKVVFEGGQPAHMPGWVQVEFEASNA